ncbi:hypothetical protein BKI52_16670 [marine bacterium AO1-C]|nr:hypothetical protein BKI52_16670 [marine bacterium AO1-C]
MVLKTPEIQGVIYVAAYLVFMGLLVFNNGLLQSSFLIVAFGLGLYAIILPMNNSFEINEQAIIIRNPLKIKGSVRTFLLEDIAQTEIFSPKNTRTKSFFLRIYPKQEGRKAFNISKHEWVTPLSNELKNKGLMK